MSPQGVYPAGDVCTIGDEISSTYEGRHITLYADNLTHSNALSEVTKGYPVIWGDSAVGIPFITQPSGENPLIAIDTEGIFCQDVFAQDDDGVSDVIPGDALFINETTLLISKIRSNATNRPFGYALGTITGGDTDRIAVRLHWDPQSHHLLDDEPLFYGDDQDVSIAFGGERLTHTIAIATPGMADGDGLFQYITSITGIATGHMAAMSTWVNLPDGADLSVSGGGIVTPHSDGIWSHASAVLTGAFIVFGAVYQAILGSADFGWLGLFRLNMNQVITAIFEVNNPTNFGFVAGVHSGAVIGSVPLYSTGGGAVKWVRVYDDAV